MENTFTKSTVYFLFFSTLIILGYIVGLITFPTVTPIVAIKESTITIEDAKIINPEIIETNELPPLPTQEINPFNGNQVINIPHSKNRINGNHNKNNLSFTQDARVTIVPKSLNANSNLVNNPMGHTSNKVEIEITGQEPNTEIDKKNMLDDLSLMDTKNDTKTTEADTLNEIKDPYAPRVPLMQAPQTGYYTKTSFGFLPKTPKGQPPLWQVYSNQTKIDASKKPIAFVLGGLGVDYPLTIKAIKTLPSQVTLGFIPYSKDLQKLMNLARDYGHEVILEIPMETHDFPRPDAGVLALKTTDTPQEYHQKLEALLSSVTGYSGVMNYLGSKYILNDEVSLTLLNDLKEYGLYFIENKTLRSGILSDLAYANHIPYGASFDIIDEVLSPNVINNNFSMIEKNTLVGKPIIATAYLSSLSLSLLQTRLMIYNKIPNSDIQLIPISKYIENHQ